MRGAWREGVVEGEAIVVGRGLALGWGGLDDVVFVVDRVGVSIPIIQVGRKISVSFLFFLSFFPSLVHDSVVSVGRHLR